MIKAIHLGIPGRARFKIKGLYRSGSLKDHLEFHLSRHNDIQHAAANMTTGNLLVTFSPYISYQSIIALIYQIIVDMPIPTASGETGPPCSRETEQTGDTLPDTLSSQLPESKDPPPWHILETQHVLEKLGSNARTGLTAKEIRLRIKHFGQNMIDSLRQPSCWKILKEQFNSLPILLLGIEACISVLSGGMIDAMVISGMIGVSAVIGFVTQIKSEREILSLTRISNPPVEVLRDGQMERQPCEAIVPGDILALRAGDFVGADCRIIQSSLLTIDESILTGESIPVAKSAAPLDTEDISLADRANMAYRGTLVTGGQGLGVVIATARQTALGRLQRMIDETTPPESPIERQLHQIGNQLILIAGSISGLICFSGLFYGGGFLKMMQTGISVAASTVPSSLPAVAAINFALGVKNMKKNHVAIRRLQGLETLGAVRTICFDKTGTITRSRLSILKIFVADMSIDIGNRHFKLDQNILSPLACTDLLRLIETGMLCSETRPIRRSHKNKYTLKGTPTENALLHLGILSEINMERLYLEYPLLQTCHHAEDRLYLKTVHKTPDGTLRICIRGRPLDVLAMCNRRLKNGDPLPLTEEDVFTIESRNAQLSAKALRVLGLACKECHDESESDKEDDFVWLGLVGMAEPIRKGVRELIGKLHHAGINTIMITGDQQASAYAVAKTIGLSGRDSIKILDSNELRNVKPELMKALAHEVDVYSRVNPAQKIRIVQALQQSGHVVAMTGDGINDGPALKAADIGIAMGLSGTDVARDVADMILERDNIDTLILAVKEGRDIFGNIKKSIRFLLATNFSTMLFTFAATSMGLGGPLDLAPALSIDIIADIFPGLALCMEPPETDTLSHPPRNVRDPIFRDDDYRRMAFEASTLSLGTLIAYGYGIARYGMGAKTGDLAFQSLTIAKLLHAVSCRSSNHRIFDPGKLPPNKYLNLALGGALMLELASLIIPGLRRFLGISRLNPLDLGIIALSGLVPLMVNEATKGGNKRKMNDSP